MQRLNFPEELLPVLARFHAGNGFDCWRALGSHAIVVEDRVVGFRFAVWAPNAAQVAVVGDFNDWQPTPLQRGEFGPLDGIWWGVIEGAQPGQKYKLHMHARGASAMSERADPFARFGQLRPETASYLLAPDDYAWHDRGWLRQRAQKQSRDAPISVYELHAGSWRHGDGKALGYRHLAEPLIAHVQRLGFTHVEFLPLTEHPYDPSWGYQCTGFYAVTARWGTPDDLRWLIDQLHQAGIGVWMDWVPAHFAVDGHALPLFDGTPLFEPADLHWALHPDWKTWVFDLARPQVRSFLLGSADWWLRSFHLDGLRVDAVASMLYLDYSRQPGQWQSNRHGDKRHLDAILFLQEFNRMVRREHAGVVTIAEESTAFSGVTRDPPAEGYVPPANERDDAGLLGFHYKWNMGWMNDTVKGDGERLAYLRVEPTHRGAHHDRLTFPFHYCRSEAFVLALSHDENVHAKGTLWTKPAQPRDLDDEGRVRDRLLQAKLLHGMQWLHPGKKLLFMGAELGQEREWNQDRELDWRVHTGPARHALQAWIAALNRLYRTHPALHGGECGGGKGGPPGKIEGFEWIDGSDAQRSMIVFVRRWHGEEIVVLVHGTPVGFPGHWVMVPRAGQWTCILHSDLTAFGGDQKNLPGAMQSFEEGGKHWVKADVPPYGVIVWAGVASRKRRA